MSRSLLVLFVLSSWSGWAQQSEWQARADEHARELAAKNGPGTDAPLRAQLLKMREEDQGVRLRLNSAPKAQQAEIAKEMEQVDARLTTKLKRIVAEKGWPTMALVGPAASTSAALILIHSSDHEWQEALLPGLRKLVEADQISGSDIATLTDKLLVARDKLQMFGTQFDEVNGKMVMLPVEDPAHLEERRARYWLPPMTEYRKLLSDMYHMPVE